MKKILTLLTGIVFLIAILLVVACNPPAEIDPSDYTNVVTIYLEAVEIDEEKHLKMYDSNDRTIVVIDTLHTDVKDSTLVVWELAESSGIMKLKKIKPKHGPGKIITGDAQGSDSNKKMKLKIPGNQKPETEEDYLIKFRCTDGKNWTIDPYLRIPRQQ